jgi:hypothetical protein
VAREALSRDKLLTHGDTQKIRALAIERSLSGIAKLKATIVQQITELRNQLPGIATAGVTPVSAAVQAYLNCTRTVSHAFTLYESNAGARAIRAKR